MIQLYKSVDPKNEYSIEDRTRQFIIGLRDEIREQVKIACPTTLRKTINKAQAVKAAYSKNNTLSAYFFCCTTKGNKKLADIKTALI